MAGPYPAFVAEMALPANRPKLQFGIYSGFAIVGAFAILALVAASTDVTPWRWAYVGLISIKLLTNAIAWLGLKRDRWVLETQSLNTFADVALMTAVIYFTGAAQSPLLPIYVIEITVLALLSNLGVSLLMATTMLVLYAGMLTLVSTGVLPPTAAPGARGPGIVPSAGMVAVTVGYAALVIGIPTAFTTATLRLLRSKERALEQRTTELIEASKQRTQFMASITHELRTPIHQVQGMAELIGTGVYGPVTDKQRDALAAIKRGAQAQLSLVDDLLTLTRAESDRLAPRVSAIEIAPLVAQVVASAEGMAGTKHLTLATDVADQLPVVASDPRLLAHVLVNLIVNAIKFTPEHGVVTIRARACDGEAGASGPMAERSGVFAGGLGAKAVMIAVSDTGVGIPPAQLTSIWQPFVQGDGGDERQFGGVGLGLALVQKLCAALGAEVGVTSEVGKGSTFTVQVPCEWAGVAPTPDPAVGAGDRAPN
jgi:signal transduction histidine kinase